jgi:hypothetical protein
MHSFGDFWDALRDAVVAGRVFGGVSKLLRRDRRLDVSGLWDYEAWPDDVALPGWAGTCRIRAISTGSGVIWRISGQRECELHRAGGVRTMFAVPARWEAASILSDSAAGVSFDYWIDLPGRSIHGYAFGRVAQVDEVGRPIRITATLFHRPAGGESELTMTRRSV